MNVIMRIILLNMFFIGFFLTAKSQQKGDPPSIMPGLGIKRTELMKIITSFNCSMVFKQMPDLNGLPNYIATDDNKTSVQILGYENNLHSAKWTFVFIDNKLLDFLEVQHISYFAYVMGDRLCLSWLTNKFNDVIKYQNKPFVEVKDFEYNRRGELKYDNIAHTLTLSFTEL